MSDEALKRYEVSDHTAGGYCEPHVAAECSKCRQKNNQGDYYLASAVDHLISSLRQELKEARENERKAIDERDKLRTEREDWWQRMQQAEKTSDRLREQLMNGPGWYP